MNDILMGVGWVGWVRWWRVIGVVWVGMVWCERGEGRGWDMGWGAGGVCFMFHISVPIIHYSCHITEAEGEVGIP